MLFNNMDCLFFLALVAENNNELFLITSRFFTALCFLEFASDGLKNVGTVILIKVGMNMHHVRLQRAFPSAPRYYLNDAMVSIITGAKEEIR